MLKLGVGLPSCVGSGASDGIMASLHGQEKVSEKTSIIIIMDNLLLHLLDG